MSRVAVASEILARALRAAVRDTRSGLLRLAATPEDEHAVHDIRVGIRKLRSVLRASDGVYRRRQFARIERRLRGVAQTTSALRDEEVLAETLALVELGPAERAAANAWLAQRAPWRAELRAKARDSLATSSVGKSLDRLIEIVDAPPKQDVPVEAFARGSLLAARRALVERLPTVKAWDAESLHALRIRFKRLRYVAEMFAAGLARKRSPSARATSEACASTARLAATFQKALGVLHDVDVARVTLQGDATFESPMRSALDAALSAHRSRLSLMIVNDLRRELPTLVMPDALDGGSWDATSGALEQHRDPLPDADA